MGWDWFNKPRGVKAVDELRKVYSNGGKHEIVADALVNRAEYYALVKQTRADNGEPMYYVGVALVRFARGEFNMGYKTMEETMGPCEAHCPARILDLADKLVPLTKEYDANGYAKAWRERCRAYHAKRAAIPADGAVIEFTREITFTDGFKCKRFKLCKRGRAMRFDPINENGHAAGFGYYRIGGWFEREYKVVS